MEASNHVAIAANEELFKVPANVALFAFGVSNGGQIGIERVLVLAIDVDLLGERKGDAVGAGAERCDFL